MAFKTLPPDEEGLTQAQLDWANQVAEDADRMTKTLYVFSPTPRSRVRVCFGPAPCDSELPASQQPRMYSIYWLAREGEPAPAEDPGITLRATIEEGHQMVMWTLVKREEVIETIERQWGRKIDLPPQDASS